MSSKSRKKKLSTANVKGWYRTWWLRRLHRSESLLAHPLWTSWQGILHNSCIRRRNATGKSWESKLSTPFINIRRTECLQQAQVFNCRELLSRSRYLRTRASLGWQSAEMTLSSDRWWKQSSDGHFANKWANAKIGRGRPASRDSWKVRMNRGNGVLWIRERTNRKSKGSWKRRIHCLKLIIRLNSLEGFDIYELN